MPVFCAAYGCNNRRSTDTRSRGITFHKFPSDTGLRLQWEVALRRKGFVATESSKLCSEHFKPEDFDRTGQIVRLRDGSTPSVFNFSGHLKKKAPITVDQRRRHIGSGNSLSEDCCVVEKMPDSCAAWGCKNRRTIQTKSRGITFHKFPKGKVLRRQWEVAVRRKGFSASESSVLCSEHFKPQDLDRTGQIVRVREGAKPALFNFQVHLQKPVTARKTDRSKKAEESLSVNGSLQLQETESLPNADHSYALPADPTGLKARLIEAFARVESLERDMRNMKKREQRAKNMVLALLKDLGGKNLINKELKDRLNFYLGKMKC